MQDSDLNIHGMYLTDLEGRELRVSWGAREGSSSGMTLYGDRDGEDLPFQFDLTSERYLQSSGRSSADIFSYVAALLFAATMIGIGSLIQNGLGALSSGLVAVVALLTIGALI